MKYRTIEDFLKAVRFAALKRDAMTFGWFLYTSLLLGFLVVVLAEAQMYFSAAFRKAFVSALTNGTFIVLTLIFGYIVAIFANAIPRFRVSQLARDTGRLIFPKSDTVINALQLEQTKDQASSGELRKVFVEETLRKLNECDINKIFPDIRTRFWKAVSILSLTVVSLVLLIWWEAAGGAIYRWVHRDTEFYAPPPFTITSLSGDQHLLGGGQATIEFEVSGARPDTVWLELSTPGPTGGDQDSSRVIPEGPDLQGHYIFTLEKVHQDFDYRAFVPAEHFWEAWREVSSEKHRIMVTDRPVIEDFSVTIAAPEYTRLEPVTQEENQANVAGLKGSTVRVDLKSNLPLEKAVIKLKEQAVDMALSGRSASGSFMLEKEDEFLIRILDTRGIANNQPIPYRVSVVPDRDPEMAVLVPEGDVQIPGNQKVPFQIEITDDFGFSSLQIGYEIHRPDFLGVEPVFLIYAIPDLEPLEPVQEIRSFWDLTGINLMPGDEIHFHFEVYDNDIISGPKKFISQTFIARIPSLASLYDSFEAEEDTLMDAMALTKEEIRTLKEALEKTELELLKSEDLSWEDKQQADKMLASAKKQVEELRKLEETISGLSEMGRDQDLFSPEIMKKFETLQDLISELLTEELLPDLEALEEALDSLDSSEIRSAMERVRKNMDRIERELDRYIDVFKRVQAEQKMEELVKRAKQLMGQQSILEEKIRKLENDSDQQTFDQFSMEETWNLEEFDKLLEDMKSAGRDIQPFSQRSRNALNELARSELARETEKNLSRVVRDLKRKNLDTSKKFSYTALENLEDMKNALEQVQEDFRSETAGAMAADLKKIMRKALVVSKRQEDLLNRSRNIPRNSPRYRDLAADQQVIQKQLMTITTFLLELSKKTFAVTPAIGKSLGASFAHMEAAKLALAERQGSRAVTEEQEALTAINRTILMLNQTSRSMEQSGTASGFEEFLKQMENLSGQQQVTNSESIQLSLGQMAASMQKSILERLLARQKQIRKSLEQLMNEMAESGTRALGDLGQVARDMDEVIKEMTGGSITRKTIERQQQILSRMLDSQKSLTQRGEKEQRISRLAEDYVPGVGPGGLPRDLGQRRSLTMEALNRSLKAGYPADYQDMIKRYFHALAQSQALQESPDTVKPSDVDTTGVWPDE